MMKQQERIYLGHPLRRQRLVYLYVPHLQGPSGKDIGNCSLGHAQLIWMVFTTHCVPHGCSAGAVNPRVMT